jgi:hypothetical protein
LVAAVGIGGLAVFGVGRVLSAIPTPSEVAAVFAAEPYLEVGPVVIESVQDLANLTTVEMVEYTIVEKGTDAGWLEWARGDSVRMFAVANIGAGIDLSGLTESSFSVSEEGAVVVTLPRAEIQYVAVDNEATTVLDRETGLFTKGDPQLETEARQIAESTLVDGSINHGILQQAEENAISVLTSFLLSLGYTDVTVRFAG